MKTLVTLRNVLFTIPVIFLLAGLHYALPQVDVVRAVGVEIKRIDLPVDAGGQQRTGDVYFLQMETTAGRPRVYRNQDNLLYGKFDASNLQAQIQSLTADKQLVALRHYGWRMTLFSTYPNAIKAWPVEEGYRHIPVFNTLVLLGLGLIAFLGFRRVRNRAEIRAENRRQRDAERAAQEAAEAREAGAAAQLARDAERRKKSDLDDFLNSGGNGKD